MKIGAGGLQAIFAQDAARGLEANKVKTPTEAALLQSEDPVVRKQLYELNKAVERMRRAAEAFNQPMDFEVKRGEKPRIKARDRRTGAERDYTLEEAEAWLEEIENGRGKNLNGYA
ncbi:MAG: hypothetical protein M1130_00815 [Actinobacteria bacterium]|nr:hypothetical protein [Actinomycetota bacterium]